MDIKEIEAIWTAFQEVQDKKAEAKLSDKQKALDVDNDGDIEGDDLADLRKKKNKADVVEEVPAAHNKKAPVRKGDKSNPDASDLPSVKTESVEDFVESLDEEQLDELSKKLLTRYKKKADAQTTDHMSKFDHGGKKPPAGSHAKFDKRVTGSGWAHDKIKGKYAKGPATRKESVEDFVDGLCEEQLDELSKKLLTRYKKKADAQTTDHMSKFDHGGKKPPASSHAKFDKRVTGSGWAGDKIKGKYAKVPATRKESVEASAWLQDLAVVLQGLDEKSDEHTKGATNPEGIADKESNKSKDFIAMHKKSEKDIEDKEEQGHKDVSKAGRATKAAPARGNLINSRMATRQLSTLLEKSKLN